MERPQGYQEKWIPVFRPDTWQNNNPGSGFDAINTEWGPAIGLIAKPLRAFWARARAGVARRAVRAWRECRLIGSELKAGAALVSLGVLAACASATPSPPLAPVAPPRLPGEVPAFAGARPEIMAAGDIYRLSPSQEKDFLDYYRDPANSRTRPVLRLYEYLKETAHAFQYSEYTRTAEQVRRLTGGNCLSLANLTTALARLAGIQTGYQLINDVPVYEKQDQTILRGVHVRSLLFYDTSPEARARSDGAIILGRPSRSWMVIDYFPTGKGRYLRRVSEPEFTAMYYRNMAAEALIRNDIGRAYWLTMESLRHAADHPDAINMLAVLYRRAGDDPTAERIYQYGMSLGHPEPSLLRNYRGMLESQGRVNDARKITDLLASLDDANPFDWWFMGEEAYEEQNYADALTYYEKSVAIAPYLHEGYFGMAKSYFQLGRKAAARKAMRQAVEHAGKARFRTLYEAKLAALSAPQ